MALKITLKPHEKIMIGGAVLTNGPSICHFHVENKVPILRQDAMLSERDVDTPCKRVYFVIQLMYISGGITTELSQLYWDLAKDIVEAAPSTRDLISQISQSLLDNQYYQALKTAKKLIQYEKELVAHVSELA
ncbi:MAG: flagellar protein FlbT [Nitrospirae bacterium GWC2_56_14]|nr:MAG: flagellar protein FlbT [Nitrospirae bacterium GWC2_56_14]